MAVGAGLAENKYREGLLRLAGMPRCDVATLTEQRLPDGQHVLVDAAVRGMAVEAVHHCGRVQPQERTALFGMASIADLIDSRRSQLLGIRTAMRIVAIGAHHQTFAHRHMRWRCTRRNAMEFSLAGPPVSPRLALWRECCGAQARVQCAGAARSQSRTFPPCRFPKKACSTRRASSAVDRLEAGESVHRDRRLVCSTWSGPAGRAVARKAGEMLNKRLVLELGGGADPDLAPGGCRPSSACRISVHQGPPCELRPAGCIAAKRSIVVEQDRLEFRAPVR